MKRQALSNFDDSDDVFDEAESFFGTRGVYEIRLSDDPDMAFRQIRVGYTKWIARYLQE